MLEWLRSVSMVSHFVERDLLSAREFPRNCAGMRPFPWAYSLRSMGIVWEESNVLVGLILISVDWLEENEEIELYWMCWKKGNRCHLYVLRNRRIQRLEWAKNSCLNMLLKMLMRFLDVTSSGLSNICFGKNREILQDWILEVWTWILCKHTRSQVKHVIFPCSALHIYEVD